MFRVVFFFFLITALETFSFLLLCVLLLLLFIHSGITDSVWIMSYHWLPVECYNAICLIETWASPTRLQRIIHFLINQAFAKIPSSLTWNGGVDNAACELRGDGDKNAFFVQRYWIILWLVNCSYQIQARILAKLAGIFFPLSNSISVLFVYCK